MIDVDWQDTVPAWLNSAFLQGVLITDDSLSIRFWNEWLAGYTGIPTAEAIGRPLLTLYPDLAARDVLRYYQRALAGETNRLPHEVYGYLMSTPALGTPAPPRMPQEAQISPLRLGERIVGTITTIVTRDVPPSAAELSDETVFRLIDTALAQAPVGFGVLDREMRFRAVNARLADYNRASPEAHLGRSLGEIFPDWIDELEPLFHHALDGQPVIGVKISGVRRSRPDEIAHWQASYFPIELGDGRRLGVGALINDITQQKHDEAAKSFLAELSTILAESLDYGATLQRLAQQTVPNLADWCAIDMIGEGERFSALAHSDPGQARLAEAIQHERPPLPNKAGQTGALLASGRPLLVASVTPAVLNSLSSDESYLQLLRELRPTSCIIIPLTSAGEVIGSMLLARNAGRRAYTRDDLALAEEIVRRAIMALENVRLYAAAQRSRALAEDAVRVRDAFFSIAAHELRTPLTTLLGRAQMLQRRLEQQANDERSQRTIQIVVAQAQRLNRMITALLDVSRIQTGRFSIESAPMDLTSLVRRVVDESRLTIIGHRVLLQDPEAPLMINGDEVRLEQMLQNLIGNAVKYSPDGSEVLVRLIDGPGCAVITVADHGIGISPEAQRQLFHRFYRAENAEAHSISGMGIGLFVVKEIVDLHSGEVGVESAEGQGSTFSVRLPLGL